MVMASTVGTASQPRGAHTTSLHTTTKTRTTSPALNISGADRLHTITNNPPEPLTMPSYTAPKPLREEDLVLDLVTASGKVRQHGKCRTGSLGQPSSLPIPRCMPNDRTGLPVARTQGVHAARSWLGSAY
ncbi:hypothetical protein Bbelb_076950 [Branchiostoma belcheri]|nr:hypothetical protein Bbelb_076950 [Branchiostoma belcheri]